MRIDDDARLYLRWEAVTNVSPDEATITLKIGDTLHALVWSGAAVQSGQSWTRTAQSEAMFTGSNVTPQGPDVALEPGQHRCEAILTLPDGQIVPARPFTLTVA